MLDYRKTLAGLSVLLTLILPCGCLRKDAVWITLANGLPEKVFAAGAGRNVIYYILKQTHEPLFRREDGENYTSRILKHWSRNINCTEFSFYPDTSLRFNDENLFSQAFFEQYMVGLVAKYDPSAKVLLENRGVTVRFPSSKKNFLDYMTEYENAPSVRMKESVEAGLGPFEVASIDKNRISLKRKTPVSDGYNEILIVEQAAQKSLGIKDRDVSDFNRIPVADIPGWVGREYLGFNNVVLKSGNLIINHPNQTVRKLIYNCVDVKEFRAAFFPAREKFRSIQTVFPVGVPGAVPGEAEQVCRPLGNAARTHKRIVLANWRSDNFPELQAFALSFRKKTGIEMGILNSSPGELMKVLHKIPRPYNAIVMHFDAVRPDQAIFLEVFFKRDGYLDFDLPKLEPMYKQMLLEEDPAKKSVIGEKIARGLRDAAVVLPLYQDEKPVYYPGVIKNISVGRGFSEYPEIAEFRL